MPKAKVVLYGSQARDEADENSDFDILIVVDKALISNEDEKLLKYPLYDIEFDTGHIISPFVVSKKDWETKHKITPFYDNVLKDGIVL